MINKKRYDFENGYGWHEEITLWVPVRINYWDRHSLHDRNINIAVEVTNNKSQKEVGKIFKLSEQRINQIYRKVCAILINQIFSIPYISLVYNKEYYYHQCIKSIVRKYKYLIMEQQ